MNAPGTTGQAISDSIGVAGDLGFDAFYDAHRPAVYELALSVLHDADAAEDVVQDVFLCLLTQRSPGCENGKLEAWLLKVARNASLQHLRKRKRIQNRERRLEPSDQLYSKGSRAEADVVQGEVAAALEALDPRWREPMELHYLHGLTQPEVAAVLGIPIGTAGSRIARGVARIREKLNDGEPTPPRTSNKRRRTAKRAPKAAPVICDQRRADEKCERVRDVRRIGRAASHNRPAVVEPCEAPAASPLTETGITLRKAGAERRAPVAPRRTAFAVSRLPGRLVSRVRHSLFRPRQSRTKEMLMKANGEAVLKEKIPFDVYTSMLLLAFMATAGSIALTHDHLQKNWYAGEQPGIAHAEHPTMHNSLMENKESYWKWLADPDNTHLSFETEVTEQDRIDYRRAHRTLYGQDVELDCENYPPHIDPSKGGITTGLEHDNTRGVPEDVLQEMLKKYKDLTAVPG